MTKKLLLFVACILLLTSSAFAERFRAARLKSKATATCTNVAALSTAHGVLYKDSNLHGGRGLTALYQNPNERTGTRKIEIRTVNACSLIGTLGLYKCDSPYGCRYYAAYGSSPTKSKLVAAARKDGSTNVLLQGKGGKWWSLPANSSRGGQVNK